MPTTTFSKPRTHLLLQDVFSILHGLVLLKQPGLFFLPPPALLCEGDGDVATGALVTQVAQLLASNWVTTGGAMGRQLQVTSLHCHTLSAVRPLQWCQAWWGGRLEGSA